MDTNKIGEWAGIVWRLLSKENREMTFEEVMKATGLDERQLAGAIGWLAREDKIIFNAPHDGKLANLSLKAGTQKNTTHTSVGVTNFCQTRSIRHEP
ncbi:winged helix-turn-helix domain-containing protein [Bacteroides thetaiotaomicron]|uniref:winged helix-turn-helix domain-containing protein n=1 Tax=Bacteroides thetaiotaomicron TaxID=818 RepID=UPI0022E07ADE|nr:winged helix-turn-helix domain-containing protein [Bacteroides thetaiotaomicron]